MGYDDVFGYVAVGITGLFFGAFGVVGLGGLRTYETKIVREEGKPAAMRIYRPGMDDILLQDSENKDRFITLDSYLRGIKDTADRALEEARIKKQVDWYDTHRSTQK